MIGEKPDASSYLASAMDLAIFWPMPERPR